MRREPVTVVRFGQLSLVDQLMHTRRQPGRGLPAAHDRAGA